MSFWHRLLTNTLCCTVMCTSVLANNCHNDIYRIQNPERCGKTKSDTKTFLVASGVAGGALALIGSTIALLSSSGSGGDADHDTTPQDTSRSILPNYTQVGNDVNNAQLDAIITRPTYTENTNQYNDIRLAYSLARGYTGTGSKIAVFDSDDTTWHGRNVAYMTTHQVAPDAQTQIYAVADRYTRFASFQEISNIIRSASDAHIYNFSWSIGNTYANKIYNRHQIEQLTHPEFVSSLSDAATKHDAIFVWASGNDYDSQSTALSALPRVVPELDGHFVNVVAWDSTTGALADFSNACGITKEYCITAPGTNLNTDKSNRPLNGTSFAAPIVSGAIAVIRQAFPYMTATQITQLLFETARDIGETGIDEVYGRGMLDMERATRPVGVALVPISETSVVQLRPTQVDGAIAQQIKSNDITFSFIDKYGRAFNTRLNDNIQIKNRSIAFERLTHNADMQIQFGQFEMGFRTTNLLSGSGLLESEKTNTITYIGVRDEFNIGDIKFFHHEQLGSIRPTASAQSMIDRFSDIYTASVALGFGIHDWTFSIGIPDTIINGNMYLNTPSGRTDNGNLIFSDTNISLRTNPSFEYNISYRFISAGFVDNPYGTDEVYMMAKTKISF